MVSQWSTSQILEGLSPSLVCKLASLSGTNTTDIPGKLDQFPWGDRAVLQAYDLIEMSRETRVNGRRILRLNSFLLEVILHAARVTAEVASKHLDEIHPALQECQPVQFKSHH